MFAFDASFRLTGHSECPAGLKTPLHIYDTDFLPDNGGDSPLQCLVAVVEDDSSIKPRRNGSVVRFIGEAQRCDSSDPSESPTEVGISTVVSNTNLFCGDPLACSTGHAQTAVLAGEMMEVMPMKVVVDIGDIKDPWVVE